MTEPGVSIDQIKGTAKEPLWFYSDLYVLSLDHDVKAFKLLQLGCKCLHISFIKNLHVCKHHLRNLSQGDCTVGFLIRMGFIGLVVIKSGCS